MPIMGGPVRPPCSYEQVTAMLEPARLAEELRTAKARHGHSLRRCAAIMQLAPFTVDRVLEGRLDPSLATVRAVLRYAEEARTLPAPVLLFLSRAGNTAPCAEARRDERGDCSGAMARYEVVADGTLSGDRYVSARAGAVLVFCRSHAEQINGQGR